MLSRLVLSAIFVAGVYTIRARAISHPTLAIAVEQDFAETVSERARRSEPADPEAAEAARELASEHEVTGVGDRME